MGRRPHLLHSSLAAMIVVVGLAACAGDDDPIDAQTAESVPVNESLCLDGPRADAPVVELIDPALDLVDSLYGAPQRYFEVSADTQRVALFVARDEGSVEVVFYCGDEGRTEPEVIEGAPQGSTFTADAVDFDPASIFDQLADELDDPDIVDFAVTGAGDDAVVQDATVRSASGGILLVLLAPDGDILAVQAQ